MKLPRRRQFLHVAAAAAALLAMSRIARAQTYPTRPVRVLEGFGSGSSADLAARLIGHWLSEHLGQHFVIENRPGAGSNIATEAVIRAAPDGSFLRRGGAFIAVGAVHLPGKEGLLSLFQTEGYT